MLKLNIKEILSFYDEKNHPDSGHVSSLTGLAGEDLGAGLIKHYFENKGSRVIVLSKSPSEHREFEKNKAKKLDRWIKVISDGQTAYYQTEIKNWSSHSIGGRKIEINCSTEQLMNYANIKFEDQWSNEEQTLKLPYVSKVLKQMKSPEQYEPNSLIYPLICYWYPIFPKTDLDIKAFYSIPCKNSKFKDVYFFSMSIYLRELLKIANQQFVEIEAPNIVHRLKKISQLFNNVI